MEARPVRRSALCIRTHGVPCGGGGGGGDQSSFTRGRGGAGQTGLEAHTHPRSLHHPDPSPSWKQCLQQRWRGCDHCRCCVAVGAIATAMTDRVCLLHEKRVQRFCGLLTFGVGHFCSAHVRGSPHLTRVVHTHSGTGQAAQQNKTTKRGPWRRDTTSEAFPKKKNLIIIHLPTTDPRDRHSKGGGGS